MPTPVSPQRCLVQVAFRPVLPEKLIRQEALPLLNKEMETKSVRGAWEGGVWVGEGPVAGTNSTTLESLGAPRRVPGAQGRPFPSTAHVELHLRG